MNIKELCIELNKRIPCRTREEADDFLSLVKDHIMPYPERQFHWSKQILFDTSKDELDRLRLLTYSGVVVVTPSTGPGNLQIINVRYKHEFNHSCDPFIVINKKL